MPNDITRFTGETGTSLSPRAVLHPALSPWKTIRTVAHSEAARAILPRTYDQPCSLPDPIEVGIEPVRQLLRELPDKPALEAARSEIVSALNARADGVQIAQIAGAAISLKTTVPVKDRTEKIEALAFMLGFEGEVEPVSPFVLAAALYELAKASPFAPDPSEVLAKLPKTRQVFEQSIQRLDLLIDAREELEGDDEFHRRQEAGEFDHLHGPEDHIVVH